MKFSDLNLNKTLLNTLDELGFVEPTPIQEKTFTAAMAGKNLVGIAQTGTGKTLAYLLPVLRQWSYNTKDRHPQILIVVPTRELVAQIVEEVKKLTSNMNLVVVGVYGGANINMQAITMGEKLDVLVATPGRLLDLALRGPLKLTQIKRFVIDEVDELLSLGFRPQLVRVIDHLPTKRQNLMFSATMTEDVEKIMNDFFDHPEIIEAAPSGTPLENIEQTGYRVPNFFTKVNLLEKLIADKNIYTKVLIFMDSKKLADQLFELIEPKFSEEIGIIHSNKAQNNRFNTVQSFKNGTNRILIATDIISRGLDIAEVSHVINFDMPEIPENYIHRIGRTGRADQRGSAMTFITEKEVEFQTQVETLMNYQIPIAPLPEDLVISTELIDEEIVKVKMKNIIVKLTKKTESAGPAFHAKSAKNSKVNVRLSWEDKMRRKGKKILGNSGSKYKK